MGTKNNLFSLAATVCALFAAGGMLQAATLPDIAATQWDMTGTLKVNAKKVGSETAKNTVVELLLGPNVTAGLAAGQWKATDSAGDSVIGTYSINKGKLTFTLDEASLENYLEQKILDVADDQGVALVITAIDVTSKSITGQEKVSKTNVTLSLKVKIKASVAGTANGQTGPFALSVDFSGSAANPLAPEEPQGSAWQIATSSKFTISGVSGKITDEDTMVMVLGPEENLGLSAGQFRVIPDNDTEQLDGTFTQSKNKITFGGIDEVLEDLILSSITEMLDNLVDSGMIQSYSNVGVVEYKTLSATATVSPGKSIKLSISVKCSAQATITDDVGSATRIANCTFTQTGVGTPVTMPPLF
jgi:hypothetical protein